MPALNFRTFDLNLLRVFDEVMTERSLTRAAQNLSLTQPAVSNAMRRLRETLGDDLLKRNGQGLEAVADAGRFGRGFDSTTGLAAMLLAALVAALMVEIGRAHV